MSRDREEFVALVDGHGAALLSTLRRLCGGDNHDADDLFQETAARVWRTFSSRPRLRNPRAWLITIGYRAFLDGVDAARPRGGRCPEDCVDERAVSPSGAAECAEWRERLEEQVRRLPPGVREVIVLHYMGGLSIRQTAAAMGQTLATTKNRLHAGLKELRSSLE